VFSQTSDEFFEQCDVISELGGRTLDLAFIDGLHHIEFALRDFINVEKCCSAESTTLIHDVYPIDATSAARERASWFWSGDIWRLILILKKVPARSDGQRDRFAPNRARDRHLPWRARSPRGRPVARRRERDAVLKWCHWRRNTNLPGQYK